MSCSLASHRRTWPLTPDRLLALGTGRQGAIIRNALSFKAADGETAENAWSHSKNSRRGWNWNRGSEGQAPRASAGSRTELSADDMLLGAGASGWTHRLNAASGVTVDQRSGFIPPPGKRETGTYTLLVLLTLSCLSHVGSWGSLPTRKGPCPQRPRQLPIHGPLHTPEAVPKPGR